jgi:prephenate dehydratase
VLEELDLERTPIDTQGFTILRSLIEQTCNDSLELFQDLQRWNPYTQEMRLRLETALDRVYETLLPSQAEPGRITIGIQGGQGSFNEEACRHYCQTHDIPDYQVRYLFTTERVLRALHQGTIDYGVFAIQNARGGVVMETIQALSGYTCDILEVFDIVISHCILHHPETEFETVDTLISHPQALAQCAANLKMRYPALRQVSGEGDQIDQALCAQQIAAGNLPRSTAVLAPRVCAELYGLRIHDQHLQDLGDQNLTTFVWVRRKRDFYPSR